MKAADFWASTRPPSTVLHSKEESASPPSTSPSDHETVRAPAHAAGLSEGVASGYGSAFCDPSLHRRFGGERVRTARDFRSAFELALPHGPKKELGRPTTQRDVSTNFSFPDVSEVSAFGQLATFVRLLNSHSLRLEHFHLFWSFVRALGLGAEKGVGPTPSTQQRGGHPFSVSDVSVVSAFVSNISIFFGVLNAHLALEAKRELGRHRRPEGVHTFSVSDISNWDVSHVDDPHMWWTDFSFSDISEVSAFGQLATFVRSFELALSAHAAGWSKGVASVSGSAFCDPPPPPPSKKESESPSPLVLCDTSVH